MNIHFQQAQNKSQVFLYMLVLVVALAVSMLIWNASRTNELHLAIYSSLSAQPVHGEISNTPVAIAAPLPPVNEVHIKAVPVPSSTPRPIPQAVPAPEPNLP